MSYGELTLPPVRTGINKQTGRFLKGHILANKGKKWSEYMGKFPCKPWGLRQQRAILKGGSLIFITN